MALVVPNVGEVALLDMLLKDASPNNQTLKLYTAVSPAIDEDTEEGDFTEPGGGTGYASKTLTRGSWNAAATAAGVTSITYAAQTFTFTSGPVTVLGYFVIEATTGTLLWCEAFSASANIPGGGGDITVTPKMQLA